MLWRGYGPNKFTDISFRYSVWFDWFKIFIKEKFAILVSFCESVHQFFHFVKKKWYLAWIQYWPQKLKLFHEGFLVGWFILLWIWCHFQWSSAEEGWAWTFFSMVPASLAIKLFISQIMFCNFLKRCLCYWW